jgi:hypothetical protein
MFTGRMSKIFVVLLVVGVLLATASFVTRSAAVPAADRSYDGIEQVRALPDTASGYDQVEVLRIHRGASLLTVDSRYDSIEQLRLGRTFNADHSYDKIEALHLER